MNLKDMGSFPSRLCRELTCLLRTGVYYVTDEVNWSFFWDGYYITKGLKEHCNLRARVIRNPWGLKRQIVHFGDRYAYLNGPFRDLHPSNRVFLTWFHGDPSDPNPGMQHLFRILPEATPFIEKIVVTCQISKEILVKLGIPEAKIVVIPLGVDCSKFLPCRVENRSNVRENLGIPADVICIGSFQKDGAGWEEGREPKRVKGPDIFLDVLSTLSTQVDNLFVLLTGPSRGYVKQQLEKMNIPYRHHYLSHYHDIVPYYQALDLYMITSRSEGGPKALLESWATGIPVVSTRVGMPADLIEHGKNGMLAELEDVENIANCAIALLEDDGLKERCRGRALEDVKHYDWSLIARRYYQALYEPFL